MLGNVKCIYRGYYIDASNISCLSISWLLISLKMLAWHSKQPDHHVAQ